MNQYLPASIRLPGGYVVSVKAVAPRTLKRIAKEDAYGCWDGSTRTIYIDKAVEPKIQRYTLTHEMMHALADWQHTYLGQDEA
jgi:Zn-dependent peptidase ImmA (M78 family)